MFVIFITIGAIIFILSILIFMWVLSKSRKIFKSKCFWCGRFIVNKPFMSKKNSFCSLKCKRQFEKDNQ